METCRLSSLHVFHHRQLFQLLPLLDSSRNARVGIGVSTVFSQFGWICFKAWFAKWEKFDGKLAIASEDFDIHESCFTNPSRQSHKACHNLPLPALSLYSLNIALCPLAFINILDLLIIHRSVLKRDLWDGFWHSFVEIGALIFQKLLLKVSSLSTSSEHSNREIERSEDRDRKVWYVFHSSTLLTP